MKYTSSVDQGWRSKRPRIWNNLWREIPRDVLSVFWGKKRRIIGIWSSACSEGRLNIRVHLIYQIWWKRLKSCSRVFASFEAPVQHLDPEQLSPSQGGGIGSFPQNYSRLSRLGGLFLCSGRGTCCGVFIAPFQLRQFSRGLLNVHFPQDALGMSLIPLRRVCGGGRLFHCDLGPLGPRIPKGKP